MNIEWRACQIDNRYLVSNHGDIVGLSGKKLKPWKDKDGYKKIRIGGREGKSFFLHRMIALTFIPSINGKSIVNHKNGIKSDNRVENLEWVNASENILHAISIGKKKIHKGSKNGKFKINAAIFGAVNFLVSEGYTFSRIAKECGISKRSVANISRGKFVNSEVTKGGECQNL